MEVTVRAAIRDDVPAIVRLLADDALGAQRELLEDPVAPVYLQAFDDMAAQPGNELLVAVFDDKVIGCLQLTMLACISRRGVRRAQIEGVRVSSRHRGDNIGEHHVIFAAAGEQLELTHRATNRGIYSKGAVRAAMWLVGKPPGLYGMKEVLGL